MTMGPDPMRRIFWISSRFGILKRHGYITVRRPRRRAREGPGNPPRFASLAACVVFLEHDAPNEMAVRARGGGGTRAGSTRAGAGFRRAGSKAFRVGRRVSPGERLRKCSPRVREVVRAFQ